MTDPQRLLDAAEQEIARADRLLARATTLPHFRCPICGDVTRSKVLEGRPHYADGYYWRRHRCLACADTFTTKEAVEAIDRPPAQAQDVESALPDV